MHSFSVNIVVRATGAYITVQLVSTSFLCHTVAPSPESKGDTQSSTSGSILIDGVLHLAEHLNQAINSVDDESLHVAAYATRSTTHRGLHCVLLVSATQRGALAVDDVSFPAAAYAISGTPSLGLHCLLLGPATKRCVARG